MPVDAGASRAVPLRFGRCSDLLSFVGVQLDAIDDPGKPTSLSTVAPARPGAKDAESALAGRRRSCVDRPSSEVGKSAHGSADAGLDLITSVIDRWRSATMSQKLYDDDGYDTGYPREDAPPMQPAQAVPGAAGLDPQRSRLLKQPLSAALGSTEPPKGWR